ncbi:MAG: hypothetical protein AABX03_00235 [Nanoarchaeota archaeon]
MPAGFQKGNLMNNGYSFRRIFLFSGIILIGVIILLFLGTYFFIALNQASRLDLIEDVCLYDGAYLTCGKQFILVFNGYEYNMTANKPFKFPEGSGNLIGLTDNSMSYVFLLSPGEYNLKDTSKVNSSVSV